LSARVEFCRRVKSADRAGMENTCRRKKSADRAKKFPDRHLSEPPCRLAQYYTTNVSHDVLLPETHPTLPSNIWLCKHNQVIIENCFDIDLAYSTFGVSQTLNLGAWDKIFKQKEPILNSLRENDAALSLNGMHEISLYIQSPPTG